MRRLITSALLAVALLLLPLTASAQSDGLQIEAVEDADYPSMALTVTVPTQLGEVALPPEAFEVSENGESRGRPTLGQSRDVTQPAAPRTVLAIDISGSMRSDIQLALAAAADFVRSLRPGSEVAVVTFGDRPTVVIDFTSDVAAVLDSIASITVDSTAETALYDGVRRANRLLARGTDDVPKSIVVLSDGGDSISNAALDETATALGTSGVAVWAVALETSDSNRDALVTLTGSADRVLSAANADELQGIYVSLASDLARQYVLRYDSQATGDTQIDVVVDWGPVTASNSLQTTIDGTIPSKPRETTRIASPDPFTVTVPLLGTTTAYGTGLIALTVAAIMLTWAVAARPTPTTTRARLLPAATAQQRPPGLTVVAEWFTDQADRRLRDHQLGGSLDRALESAGLDIRAGELVVGVLSMMIVAYALGLAVANSAIGIILALLVPLAARLTLSIRRDRRQAAFAEQFIDVLQLLAGSLRAGYGLLQGIDAVARDAQDPAAGEFRRILVEHRLGRDLTEAMDNCAARMANNDFVWVVQAISIHREVGGDLARVLDNIVGTVRERAAVQRQVRALSAEGRLSAIVLTALPFVTALVISVASPGYLTVLTTQPVGWVLIGIAAAMLLIGTVVIRRLAKIQY